MTELVGEGHDMESTDDVYMTVGRLRHDLTLEQLFPELTYLEGTISAEVVPQACRRAVMENAPTWETLRTSTIGQIAIWPMVGPGRLTKIVQFCRSQAGIVEPGPQHGDNSAVSNALADALGTLGAWAKKMDIDDDLESCLEVASTTHVPPSVIDAAAVVESLQLGVFATEQQLDGFDWWAAAQNLIDQFDTRERDILERLITEGVRPTVTLEELGNRYGVTREAIRLQQSRVSRRFRDLLAESRFEIVSFRAEQLRRLCGSATPVELAPREVVPTEDDSFVDELFAHLAGPYRVSDGWIYLQEFGDNPFNLVQQAFENTMNGFTAPIDAMLDDLEAKGLNPITAMMLIEDCSSVRVLDDDVISWTKYEDKVGGILQHVGHPLSVTEIARFLEAPDKERSITSHLASSDYAHRVGVHQWALRDWGLAEYRSIIEHMASELKEGPCDLSDLASSLSQIFGVSPNSVKMYGSMHPMFVLEGSVVRLRGDHEPYRPDTELRESDGCVMIERAWAYRTVVDRDLLRGSGRSVPEAFAVHVGLHPGAKISLQCGDRNVKLSWTGMAPDIGSLRWYAQQQRLVEGDYVFIRSSGLGELDFRCVRKTDLADSPLESRLLRLLGIKHVTEDLEEESLRNALMSADADPGGSELQDERSALTGSIVSQMSESLGYLPSERPSGSDLRQALRQHSDLPRLEPEPDNWFEVTKGAIDNVRQLPELAVLHPDLPAHVADALQQWIGDKFLLDEIDPQPARKLVLGYINELLRRAGEAEIAVDTLLYRNLSAKLTAAIRSG